MRAFSTLLVLCFVSLGFALAADNPYRFKSLEGGWRAMTKQTDPFDKTKTKIVRIQKGNVTFECNELNMRVHSDLNYDGFSINVKIKYVLDQKDAVDKEGKFATYLGASDSVTRETYFFASLSDADMEKFRVGRELKVAGELGSMGWVTREADLSGFAAAYDMMCE